MPEPNQEPSVRRRVMSRLQPRGEFGRSVLTVMSGTVIAQAVPVLASPVLTRLYTPADFGVFALFLATAAVFGTLATGRYELAVMLPEDNATALSVVRLCLLVTLAVTGLSLGAATLFGSLIGSWFENDGLRLWALLVPVSVLLTGVQQTFNHWSNRGKRFRRVARSRVAQSFTAAMTIIAIGSFQGGPAGLIVGYLSGQTVAVVWIVVTAYRGEIRQLLDAPRVGARRIASRYRDFPRFMGPAALLGVVSSQLPVLLLTSFFGATVAGFVSLSQRVIRLPISVVAQSIGEVFRQRASEDYVRRGECRGVFLGTLKNLGLIATLPFGTLAVAAPWLFAFVFGEEWRTAGEYAQIFAAMYFLQFIVSPLSFLFMVAERQKASLVLQAFLVTACTAALVAGYRIFGSATAAIALLTAAYVIKYCAELALSYRFSKGGSRQPVGAREGTPEVVGATAGGASEDVV